MADFIFKPSANANGNFTDALEFESLVPTDTVPVAGGTYDVYQKVVSGFEVVDVSAQFAVADVGQEPVITATAGDLSVTIGAGIHAGTYTQNIDGQQLTVAMIEAGATCYKRPSISGGTNVGDTLTITPGLWLFAGADPVTRPFSSSWTAWTCRGART